MRGQARRDPPKLAHRKVREARSRRPDRQGRRPPAEHRQRRDHVGVRHVDRRNGDEGGGQLDRHQRGGHRDQPDDQPRSERRSPESNRQHTDVEGCEPRAQGQPAEQEQHRDRQGEGGRVAHEDVADRGQVGVSGRGVDERQADHDERARDTADHEQPQAEVRPPQGDEHHPRRGRQLEARPQPDQVGRGGGDHDPKRGQERHREAEVERVFGRPVGRRERDGGRQQRRRLGKQREPILNQGAAEEGRQGRAGPQLDAQRDQHDQRRRLWQVGRRCAGNPAEATREDDEDRHRDDKSLRQQDQVSHRVAPGLGTGAT